MKQLLAVLSLSLVLASCGSNGSAPAPAEPGVNITSISGSVTAGSGAGTVSLKSAAGTVLAEAPVNEQGAFTLTLPNPDQFASELKSADSLLSAIGCEGTLNSSTSGVLGYTFAGLQLVRGDVTDTIVPASLYVRTLPPYARINAYAWVYADRASELTGTLNCSKLISNARSVSINVNAPIHEGWNILFLQAEASTFSGLNFNGTVYSAANSTPEWKTATELRNALPSFLR